MAERASIGGWGLGGGHEDKARLGQEEEEDEPPSDWDPAQVCLIDIFEIFSSNSHGQAVVERTIGINTHPESRRKLT